MSKLLMISGLGGIKDLARGKRGALFNTLEEFHRYWERIDIIVPRVSPTTYYPPPATHFFGNVFLRVSPWPLLFHPWWFLKKGVQIYREQKFDLMTVHDFPPFYNGIGAYLLWQQIQVPYILEIHHIPGYPRAADWQEWIYRQWLRGFIKFDAAKAKTVRVVNQQETPEFLKKAGVPAGKITYIPSAYIDLETFRVYPEVSKEYDLVFAARLEKNKGIFNLLEAIKIAKRQKPDIKLLIIGGGPEKKKIELQTTNYKLQTNVFFSGWLETSYDVARAYNRAEVFINPSFNEGGPRVALEAMACGLPVITTKVGLMHDLIKDGENGFFTDWSPEKMAETILHLLGSADLKAKFQKAGLTIAQRFERKAAIRDYAEGLQKFL